MKRSLLAVLVLGLAVGTSSKIVAAEIDDCPETPMMQWRRCMAANIEKLNKQIDKKVFDVCRRETGDAPGPAGIDDRLICRLDRLSRIVDQIN